MLRNIIKYNPLYARFCGGYTIHEAMNKFTGKCDKIYDFVREYEPTASIDTHNMNVYALANTNNSFHAIKLSSLNISQKKYDFIYSCLDEYATLCHNNNNKILIDAEDVLIQDDITKITDLFIHKYNTKRNPIFFKTYQMYRKDTLGILCNDIYQFKDKFAAKIVRGAYLHQDKKVSNVIHDTKGDTDNDYNSAIKVINKGYLNNIIQNNRVIIATHNKYSCNYALEASYNFYFAQLLGMADSLSESLVSENAKVFKYVPYGSPEESIPYLTRRLYENNDMLKYVDK